MGVPKVNLADLPFPDLPPIAGYIEGDRLRLSNDDLGVRLYFEAVPIAADVLGWRVAGYDVTMRSETLMPLYRLVMAFSRPAIGLKLYAPSPSRFFQQAITGAATMR